MLVVGRRYLNRLQTFCVESAPDPYDKNSKRKELYVLVWCWDWSGKEMIKVFHWLHLEKFRGTKEISQLACYPIKYYGNGNPEAVENLKKDIRKRGSRYNQIVRSMSGATQMYFYKGDAMFDGRTIVGGGGDGNVRPSPLIIVTTTANMCKRRMRISQQMPGEEARILTDLVNKHFL